jgi:flagellar basal body P-ring formation protein FlgA
MVMSHLLTFFVRCVAVLGGVVSVAYAGDIQWQSPAAIEAAAREHVEAHGMKLGMRRKLQAGPLDERLRLVQCSRPFATAFAPGVNAPPRMTVEVRCPVAGGWKVYVPVKVSAFDRAVVATRALDRGHLLTAADITVTDSDVSGLPAGYARDPAKIDGLRLSRPVVAGTVLTSAVLEIDPVIRRGDRVTAVAQIHGISVRTQALALAAGGLDQRIRLKSLSSGKEIEGVVRGEALVEIAVR